MANIIDYIEKYGDLTFEEKGFNSVDNLVFSTLSYLDYTKCKINGKRTLAEISEEYYAKNDYITVKKLGVAQRDAYQVLKLVAKSPRYQNLLVSNYVYYADRSTMFAAMTFHVSYDLDCIVFEGTDEKISGWREDFELAYRFPVPSQTAAIKYLNKHIKLFGPHVIVCGHSKGGNLAQVAAMYARRWKFGKIIRVYNNDGPGLRLREFESKNYRRVRGKLMHIVPHCSMVGVLMRNDRFDVVKSDKNSIMGHAILSWQVNGDKLAWTQQSQSSKEMARRILHWLNNHSDEQRENAVSAVFDTIEKCGVKDTMSLTKFENVAKLIKETTNIDKESRDLVLSFLKYVVIKK